MPRLLSLGALIALALLGWLWLSGGFDALAYWAAGEQRDFQNTVARSLRALKGGEAGAFALLLAACFAYGFFHAVGPGHGKVLLGGYGLGRRVPLLRLAGIGLLASLGQAVTAIVLVYAGVWVLSLTRERMVGFTEGVMAPVSYAAIGLIGLWLAWRGLRHARGVGHHHHHDHDHDAHCDHRHGPTLDEVAHVHSLREALALIAGIAIRPCSGALFVLLITWQMGIGLAGIAAALVMGLGTATVTVATGLAAAGLRGGLLGGIAGSPLAARAVPVIEIAAGLFVMAVAGGLLLRAVA
ncbi:MAG: hypothetical protein KDK24_15355 [Pseudooceanicola sp.]|nr:hypothetical protein [Pseudooceanicola sp.]